jgi:hypothetical protein
VVGFEGGKSAAGRGAFAEVDFNTPKLVWPHIVGIEHTAPAALRHLGFEEKLTELGFNRLQVAAAVCTVIGRMTVPGCKLSI